MGLVVVEFIYYEFDLVLEGEDGGFVEIEFGVYW